MSRTLQDTESAHLQGFPNSLKGQIFSLIQVSGTSFLVLAEIGKRQPIMHSLGPFGKNLRNTFFPEEFDSPSKHARNGLSAIESLIGLVVGSFLCDDHVMHMRFPQACRGEADKAGVGL